MKTTITILSAFLWSLLPCLAFPPHLMVVVKKKVAGGGPTYIINQDFNGIGYGNGESWTESSTSVNEDYTTVILEGTHSLNIPFTIYTQISISNASSLDVYWVGRLDTGDIKTVVGLRDSGGGLICGAIVNASGNMACFTNGATGTYTSNSIPDNTGTTHFWLHWEDSGTCSIAFSSDGVRPTSGTANYQTKTTTTGTLALLRLGHSGGAVPMVLDRVLMSEGTIGDNP